MADTVTVTKIKEAGTKVVYALTNKSDATGEASVVKINASTLAAYQAGATLTINKIRYSISGTASVQLIFGGGTPATAVILSGNGDLDLSGNMSAPIPSNAGTPNGNILLSTIGFVANSTYNIIIECSKVGFNL